MRVVLDAWPEAEVRLAKEEPAFEAAPGAAGAAQHAFRRARPLAEVGVPYASEAGHWSPRAPTVLLGPGRIEDAHGPDESVAEADLERAVLLYATIVDAHGGAAR